MVSLNKALLNPYFWGGTLGGGRLTSHEKRPTKNFSLRNDAVDGLKNLAPVEVGSLSHYL